MYEVTNIVPKGYDTRRHGHPVLCLADEHGGQSVVAVDDHCFVLFNGSDSQGIGFKMVIHWHKDAILALRAFLEANPSFICFI